MTTHLQPTTKGLIERALRDVYDGNLPRGVLTPRMVFIALLLRAEKPVPTVAAAIRDARRYAEAEGLPLPSASSLYKIANRVRDMRARGGAR